MMKKTLILLFLSLVSYTAFSQFTPYYYPKPYLGMEHRGLFLSIAYGYNYTNVSIESVNYGETLINGSGTVVDVKLGGAICENFILHCTILSNATTGPKINSDYWNISNVKTDNKYYVSDFMFGVGATYYNDYNFLFSASIGLASYSMVNEKEDIDITSDGGYGIQLKAGKEWWISARWGIGVAAFYNSTNDLNLEGEYEEERIKSKNFGVVFNATFNGIKK